MSIFAFHIDKVSFSNLENGYISAPESKLKKTKGSLFSQTLKVEESKVSFFFSIFAQGLRYRHFLNLRMAPC